MSGNKKQGGYTVIEVMLFMAISGFMFIIAATAISGKHAQAQFKQGVQSTNEVVRQIANDVANGYYPSNSDFSCSGGSNITTVTSTGQGQNKGCIFMGKVLKFNFDADNTYDIYSLSGRQFKGSNSAIADGVPTNLNDASPAIVDRLTESGKRIEWGLTVTKVINKNSGNAPLDGIAFIKSFGSYGSSGLDSGNQDVIAIPIPRNTSNPAAYVKNADSLLAGFSQVAVNICFDDDGRQGAVVIGGSNGQRLTTEVKIGRTAAEVGC